MSSSPPIDEEAPVVKVTGAGLARDVCAHLLASHGFLVEDLHEVKAEITSVTVVVEPQPARSSEAGGGGAVPPLTRREVDIIASIDRGLAVKQTARELGVTAKTVENLQSRLFRKLQVRNRAQAVARAHALGLLPFPGGDGA